MINRFTHCVNGGKLNVISRTRKVTRSCQHPLFLAVDTETHRSGKGTTGKLRCPSASTALTAKMTLSLESFSVMRNALPAFSTCSHSGLVVARHKTSYPVARPPGDASQVSVESLSKSLVTRCTFVGGAGANANDASVAAFSRAT